MTSFDFQINPLGRFSNYFLEHQLYSFKEAAQFIKELPYKRNTNKEDLFSVFKDGHGTCSTKHAILKQLAVENNEPELQLILCIFKMNPQNTPKLADILEKHQLPYIPEAHNYLKFRDAVLDYTFPGSLTDIKKDVLEELIIEPHQITTFKVDHHKNFFRTWLSANAHLPYSLPEIWEIRERCIQKLSKK